MTDECESCGVILTEWDQWDENLCRGCAEDSAAEPPFDLHDERVEDQLTNER